MNDGAQKQVEGNLAAIPKPRTALHLCLWPQHNIQMLNADFKSIYTALWAIVGFKSIYIIVIFQHCLYGKTLLSLKIKHLQSNYRSQFDLISYANTNIFSERHIFAQQRVHAETHYCCHLLFCLLSE